MKVVLFCGGLGLRLRDYSEHIPKPMINIGYRPILWHVMKYYAYYGYHDFVLCLGYGADVVKNYFLNYDECLSNDFVLSHGARPEQLHGRPWQLVVTAGLLAVALCARVLADVDPARTAMWIAIAGSFFLCATIFWGAHAYSVLVSAFCRNTL